jgi:hypothetical protein
MSVLSQLMRPEDFVQLDAPSAARLEAAVHQIVVTDQNRLSLQKQVEDLKRNLPQP